MKLRSIFSILVLLSFGATGGLAQMYYWSGDGSDGTIDSASNWLGGVPTFASGYEDVTFGDATQTTVLLGSVSRKLRDLTFSSSTAAYSFVGTSLPTFTITGNITTEAANLNPVVFDSSIAIAFTAGTHTINVAAGSAVGFLADISGSGASIAKTGAGTLTLSGVNTYDGGTTVNNGTLQVDGGSISHLSASTYVGSASGDDGTLAITNGGSVSNSTGYIGRLPGSSGTVTVDGSGSTWTNQGALYVGNTGNGTLFVTNGGAVSSNTASIGYNAAGSGAVTVDGAGSSWTDSNSVEIGSSGGGTLSVTGGGHFSSRGIFIGDFAGSNGAVVISGAGSSFNDDTNGTEYVGFSGTGALLITEGGAANITGGSGTVYLGYNATGIGTLNIGAQQGDPAAAGGILNAATVTTFNGLGTVQFNTTANSAAPYYFTKTGTSGGAAVLITGATQVISSAGYNVLTGANTYTGGTSIFGDTLAISSLADGGKASNIGASTSDASNLVLTGGGTLQYTGGAASTDRLFSLGFGGGAIDASGTGAVVFTNTGAMGFAVEIPRTLTLTGTNTGDNTLAAVIGDYSGATSFIKSGPGTWVLTGANTYTGTTTIAGGMLSASSLADGGKASNIGASTNDASNLVLTGGTLQYTGGAASTDRLFSLGFGGGAIDASGTGAVVFTNTGAMGFAAEISRTLTLTGINTDDNTLAAVIGDYSGATSLIKSGPGTWVLTGANTYTGGTTIHNGTLEVAGGSISHPAADLNVGSTSGDNGALAITGGGTVSDGVGQVGTAGSGTVTVDGTGSKWENQFDVAVGGVGTSTIAVTNGGTVTSNDVYLDSGIITIDGIGSSWTDTNGIYVGLAGTGAVSVTHGGLLSSCGATLGMYAGDSGTVTVDGAGSVWTMAHGSLVGNSGAGALTIANGGRAVNLGSGVESIMLGYGATGTGTLNIGAQQGDPAAAAGFLDAAEVTTGAGMGTVQFNTSATGATPYYFTQDGTSTGTAVAITGPTQLINTAGYNVLSGASTYNGVTNILSGTLADGAADAFSPNSPVVFSSGANLNVNFNEEIAGLNSLTPGSGTANIANGATLTINNDAGNCTFSGGIAGAGSLSKTGAGTETLTGANTYVGSTTVNGGILSVDGGSINHPFADMTVDASSVSYGADLSITNGGQVASNNGYIGNTTNNFNTVTVDGAGSTWTNTNDLYVSNSGPGALLITNGGAVGDNYGYIGINPGGSGAVTVNGAGSIWTTTNDLHVGFYSNGTLAVANGGVVTFSSGDIGASAGGSVTVDGAGSSFNDSSGLCVGSSGTGTLVITSGGSASGAQAVLGNAGGSSGTVMVDGAGSSFARSGSLTVGELGNGMLSITNGGSVSSSNSVIGHYGGSSGMVMVSGTGSTWTDASHIFVGDGGIGALTIADDCVVSVDSGSGIVTLGSATGVGTLNVGAEVFADAAPGGILNAAEVHTGTGTGIAQFNTTATNAAPYYFTQDGTSSGTAVLVSGPTQVINTGGYNVFTGANTYTGSTTITGGTLAVSNGASLGLSSVTLDGGQLRLNGGVTLTNPIGFGAGGGVLCGDGAFGSPISVGSNVVLSPGNSPGTLTFTSGLTLASSGRYDWQIQSVAGAPGSDCDFLSITGALDIAATPASPFTIRVLSLDPSGNPGFVSDFSSGTSYSWTIASASGGINGFDPVDFTIDASGFENSLGTGSFFLSADSSNLMLNFTPVPEPSTYALMAAGLVVLLWRRRRVRG